MDLNKRPDQISSVGDLFLAKLEDGSIYLLECCPQEITWKKGSVPELYWNPFPITSRVDFNILEAILTSSEEKRDQVVSVVTLTNDFLCTYSYFFSFPLIPVPIPDS